MPGVIVHIIIADKYLEKNKDKKINRQEFIKGAIAPDLNENLDGVLKRKEKDISHYNEGPSGDADINFKRFFNDVDITKDYWKGYFMHLLVDYYFYNYDFKEEYREAKRKSDTLHDDWDAINKVIVPKYKIEHINSFIDKFMQIKDIEGKYFNAEQIIEFIEKMKDLDLEQELQKRR